MAFAGGYQWFRQFDRCELNERAVLSIFYKSYGGTALYTLLITGVCGGAGATSVTANLAAAMQLQGMRCLVLDLNPANLLRYNFAVRHNDRAGWARAHYDGESWHEAAYLAHSGVAVLPFGELSVAEVRDYHSNGNLITEQLGSMLSALSEMAYDCVLIDGPVDLQFADVAAVNARLWVTVPSAGAYAVLKRYGEHWLDQSSHLLINRLSPHIPLWADIASLLRQDFAEKLTPVGIHDDLAVAETQAMLTTVLETAVDSQATRDFQALARFYLAAMRGRRG